MQHNGLSKKNILRSGDVKKAFSNVERKIHTKHFTFLVARSDVPSICIILAKKKIKLAVRRNQCRRLLKEFFRQNKDFFPNKSLVVLAKDRTDYTEKQELWRSIENFFRSYKKL